MKVFENSICKKICSIRHEVHFVYEVQSCIKCDFVLWMSCIILMILNHKK